MLDLAACSFGLLAARLCERFRWVLAAAEVDLSRSAFLLRRSPASAGGLCQSSTACWVLATTGEPPGPVHDAGSSDCRQTVDASCSWPVPAPEKLTRCRLHFNLRLALLTLQLTSVRVSHRRRWLSFRLSPNGQCLLQLARVGT